MQSTNTVPTIPMVDVTTTPATDPNVQPPPVQKDDNFSQKFGALAKRQRVIEQEKARIAEEKKQFDAERQEYLKWKEEQAKPKPKKNPLEALMAEGYTYEQATEFIMNEGKVTAEQQVKEVESKLEKFMREQKEAEEKKLKDAEEQEKKNAQEAEQKAVAQVHEQIKDFISKNPDDYELINIFGAEEMSGHVYAIIEAHYNEALDKHLKDQSLPAPKILSYKEAADELEKYLESEAEKAANTKKLKAKFGQKIEDPKKDDPTNKTPHFQTKTLANTLTASASAVDGSKWITDEEREKRALALLA